MTAPAAEVLITPEVSVSGLRAMEKDFNRTTKRIAKDTENQLEKSVSRGMIDGARNARRRVGRSLRGAGSAVSRGFDNLGGARAMAGGIFGVGVIGFLNTIEKADQAMGALEGFLSESKAKSTLALASQVGITDTEMGQFTDALKRHGGFTEQQDINDIIFDLNERTEESAVGGNPVLQEFIKYSGIDRVNRILASLATLDDAKQVQILGEMGFSGEVGTNLISLLSEIQRRGISRTDENGEMVIGVGAKNTLFLEHMQDILKEQGSKTGDTLKKERDLAGNYRTLQLKQESEIREKMVNAIDPQKIAVASLERARETDLLVKAISGFEQNMSDATIARSALSGTMEGLSVVTQELTGVISRAVDSLDSLGALDAVGDAWKSVTGQNDNGARQ